MIIKIRDSSKGLSKMRINDEILTIKNAPMRLLVVSEGIKAKKYIKKNVKSDKLVYVLRTYFDCMSLRYFL